jgi:hypothetical protein
VSAENGTVRFLAPAESREEWLWLIGERPWSERRSMMQT